MGLVAAGRKICWSIFLDLETRYTKIVSIVFIKTVEMSCRQRRTHTEKERNERNEGYEIARGT
jgi:hypothetical protein